MALTFSTAQQNARLDANTTYVGNAGKLIIYAGTAPADARASLGSPTVLATFTMGTPFAGSASSGALSVTLPSNVTASGTGTATFFRLYKSDGTTVSAQGNVTTDLVLNNTSITSGQTVSITAFSYTEGN